MQWLIGELEEISQPIDLVGHDWGGAFVARVACLRPDLLRSWVCDVTGLLHPNYVWHDFAQIWQTPGAGEQYFADTLAMPAEARVELHASIGITPDVAAELVAAGDEEMRRCVLALYSFSHTAGDGRVGCARARWRSPTRDGHDQHR